MVVIDGGCWFEEADDTGFLVDCLDFLFFFVGEFFISDFVADVEAPFVVVGAVRWSVFVNWLFVVCAVGFVVGIFGFRIGVIGIVGQFVFVCGLEV